METEMNVANNAIKSLSMNDHLWTIGEAEANCGD